MDEINWCKECNGTGGDSSRACYKCHGKGSLPKMEVDKELFKTQYLGTPYDEKKENARRALEYYEALPNKKQTAWGLVTSADKFKTTVHEIGQLLLEKKKNEIN